MSNVAFENWLDEHYGLAIEDLTVVDYQHFREEFDDEVTA